MRLILGSASPRRRELLAQIGVTPDEVRPPDIDETPRKSETPRPYCIRMAADKVAAVSAGADELVLCADTTVAAGRRILGKPADETEAERFLRLLSGRRHTVITAVALKLGARVWAREVVTAVKFKRLSDEEIGAYLRSGEWRGKAGGYAIHGLAGALIPWISGSFTGVVGLPLTETANLLRAAGYPVNLQGPAK
ncbi:septum formation protein Maf [Pikeienuella piscinae]|uniref:Nucleoside triphosphate pyrophosphatase n=1 Tax=Pikeienuella piscinae TaxID=2748098 RepID=A0A7M3T5K2_9RHOB|nr:nucleoside triphosphate pyrophosphatase [Pikeienuella piscinae]QIE57283.1 septum formation protein Maf [Pikeienuella piscinae]